MCLDFHRTVAGYIISIRTCRAEITVPLDVRGVHNRHRVLVVVQEDKLDFILIYIILIFVTVVIRRACFGSRHDTSAAARFGRQHQCHLGAVHVHFTLVSSEYVLFRHLVRTCRQCDTCGNKHCSQSKIHTFFSINIFALWFRFLYQGVLFRRGNQFPYLP